MLNWFFLLPLRMRSYLSGVIIWSGLGFLPILIFIFAALGFSAGTNNRATDRELAYALIVTGIITSTLGWWLRNRPGRVVVDKATGQEITLRSSHSLFFIPLLYWGPIFAAMAIYLFVTGK
jgi:hypothetical protein